MASTRYRNFSCVFYGSQDELMLIIRKYRCRIVRYAFIHHDRDVYLEDRFNDDGVLVNKKGDAEKPHIQLLFMFYNAMTDSAVRRLLKTENDNAMVQVTRDIVSQYRYLTHKDDAEKYQYADSDIITDDVNYFESLCVRGQAGDKDMIAENIVNDIIRGISTRILVQRYGRDFIIHMEQYKNCASCIMDEDRVSRIGSHIERMNEQGILKEHVSDINPFDDEV